MLRQAELTSSMARWLVRENYMGALGTISKSYVGHPFTQISSYAFEFADMDAPGVMYLHINYGY